MVGFRPAETPLTRFLFISDSKRNRRIFPIKPLFEMNKVQIEPKLEITSGSPLMFGATFTKSGYNFALFSRHATAVTLLLFFQKKEDADFEVVLHPQKNRTGDVWHVHVRNLPEFFLYAYRLDGPFQPEAGHLFHAGYRLLDPYATAISGLERWGERNLAAPGYLGQVAEIEYDWEDDRPPHIPLRDSIIYELHVRGYTRAAGSGVDFPGTFRGIVEKIDYLKELGITAIELLPVFEFDETDCRYVNPESGEKLLNYWGYSPIGFFALKTGFAAAGDPAGAVREFRDMVKALHAESIEVILDVVYNHSAEGDREGAVLNYKGIENSVYYLLDESGSYRNYAGCGNTLNSNHPVVQQLIIDSLRYWVAEMHVDGFRFDLASILTRDEAGNVMENPPLLNAIAKDPLLSRVKIIAEAWDAAGLYQVGNFPAGRRWAEWNGRYRDAIRRFVTGEPGLTGEVASRIAGSEDLYRHSGRCPYHSINFVTSHDGFTLMDLVSYHNKHNLLNGQGNQDGHDFNFSSNNGVEGETDDPKIQERRQVQIRNMATLLMLSQGTPMMLAGDEFGNSQHGNNNAWCQDNEISWLNWELLNQNSDLFRFWQKLIRFRKRYPSLRRNRFFTGAINPESGTADISWHNVRKNEPSFNTAARSLAFMIDNSSPENPKSLIYAAVNFSDAELTFELPLIDRRYPWRIAISTSDPSSFLNDKPEQLSENQSSVSVAAFSITVLMR